MTRVTVLLLLLLAVSGFSTAARAQDKVVREADKTVFRKKTTIDFTDVAVEGEGQRPKDSWGASGPRGGGEQVAQLGAAA